MLKTITCVAALLFAQNAFADEKPARCLFVEDGVTIMDGACTFHPDIDGSFSIDYGQVIEGVPEHFVQVLMDGPGQATAMWNGGEHNRRAHNMLGSMRRSDTDRACWVGESSTVCAY